MGRRRSVRETCGELNDSTTQPRARYGASRWKRRLEPITRLAEAIHHERSCAPAQGD